VLTLSGTLAEGNGGAAIAGQTVHFTLGNGSDMQSCDGATDGQGNASCTISSISVTPGSIAVSASYGGNADYQPGSATGSFTLGKEDVHLAYTGVGAADVHDGVTLSGTLTEQSDGSGPVIASQPITLSLGSQSCQGTTDALGHASCALAITQTPGSATVTAGFAGNADYNPTSATASFTVNKEETALTYTGSLHPVANGQSATLAATLADPADQTEGESAAAPLAGETVTLALGSQSCTGTTAADGTVSCTIASVKQPTGFQPVSVSFGGDGSYLPSADSSRQVLVFSYLGAAGAFVLGDQTVSGATSSTTVTWWGSDWTSTNSLSTGPAPTAFKGYAPSFSQNGVATATPTCGASYSFDSTGGNSSAPPPASSVPPYMAVVVTSQVTQSGSIITGNIRKIVIVKTDPGYAPNVGHAGTGTIVATVCG
jgi:hypothetical protein